MSKIAETSVPACYNQSMEIQLSSEMEKSVRKKVDGATYRSASEVVEDALLLLEERDRREWKNVEELRSKIEAGLAQARQGQVRDGEQVFEEVLQAIEQAPSAK